MSRRRIPAALAAIALMLAPAVAGAQTAGDEQYEDPFAGQGEPTEEPGTVTEEAPGLGAAPPSMSEGTGAPEEAAPAPSVEQLPVTGSETVLIAMLGSGMLLAGAGLRLRLHAGARA